MGKTVFNSTYLKMEVIGAIGYIYIYIHACIYTAKGTSGSRHTQATLSVEVEFFEEFLYM